MHASTSDELARFDVTLPLAGARTPPKSWYTRSDFLALERERVFHRNWQVAGRAAGDSGVSAPGSYITGETAGAPWLVVRDMAGDLRAFHNVCRHKATVVASGHGHCAGFTCPYHGWRYDLTGRLRSAPELGPVENFDPQAHGLVPAAVESIGDLVFVALNSEPRDLRADLAPIAEVLATTASMTWVATRSYELDCNWKVYVDNYLDGGYHVAHVHPALAAELSLESYQTELTPRLSVQSSQASAAGAKRLGEHALYAFAHPNWMVNRYGPILDLNRVEPLGTERTRVIFDWWFEPQAAADADFVERSIRASEQVQLEDVDICAAVQRGLSSPAYDRGPYSVRREAGEHHFHRLLHADLSE